MKWCDNIFLSFTKDDIHVHCIIKVCLKLNKFTGKEIKYFFTCHYLI